MYHVDIIPISKRWGSDQISYVSSTEFTVGDIIKVKIGKKMEFGCVIRSSVLLENRMSVRAAAFQTKLIPSSTKSVVSLPEQLIKRVCRLADFYACSPGLLLYHFYYKYLALDNFFSEFPTEAKTVSTKKETITNYLQTTIKNRVKIYNTLFKELKSKDKKLVILVPTHQDLDTLSSLVSFEHTRLSRRTTLAKIITALADEQAIIARIDLGPLILLQNSQVFIENPLSDAHYSMQRPFFSWRHVIEDLSQSLGLETTVAGELLDPTSWQGYGQNIVINKYPVENSYHYPAPLIINRKGPYIDDEHMIFDKGVLNDFKEEAEKAKRIVFYVTKKGLFPITSCSDCGHIQFNKQYRKQIENYERNQGADLDQTTAEARVERCLKCNGWRLASVGISLGQVEQILKSHNDSVNLLYTADTVTKSRGEIKREVSKFYETGGIFLTTRQGLELLEHQVDHSWVVSIDAHLAVPNLIAEHSAFDLLLKLRRLTTSHLVIQTRYEKNNVVTNFMKGNVRKFQQHHIRERKELGYPPFHSTVKIENVEQLPNRYIIIDELRALGASFYPDRDGNTIVFFSIAHNKWPDQKITSFLKQLPPPAKISVNHPELI